MNKKYIKEIYKTKMKIKNLIKIADAEGTKVVRYPLPFK